jgi:hypothetical protein
MNEDLQMCVDNIKEYANAILMECEKWKEHPECIFRHGYAEEKNDMIKFNLEKGLKILR